MTLLTVTAKGQITLKRSILDRLGIQPGEKVNAEVTTGGTLEITPIRAARSGPAGRPNAQIWRARGILHRSGQRALTLEEMQDAIETGAVGE